MHDFLSCARRRITDSLAAGAVSERNAPDLNRKPQRLLRLHTSRLPDWATAPP